MFISMSLKVCLSVIGGCVCGLVGQLTYLLNSGPGKSQVHFGLTENSTSLCPIKTLFWVNKELEINETSRIHGGISHGCLGRSGKSMTFL